MKMENYTLLTIETICIDKSQLLAIPFFIILILIVFVVVDQWRSLNTRLDTLEQEIDNIKVREDMKSIIRKGPKEPNMKDEWNTISSR